MNAIAMFAVVAGIVVVIIGMIDYLEIVFENRESALGELVRNPIPKDASEADYQNLALNGARGIVKCWFGTFLMRVIVGIRMVAFRVTSRLRTGSWKPNAFECALLQQYWACFKHPQKLADMVNEYVAYTTK